MPRPGNVFGKRGYLIPKINPQPETGHARRSQGKRRRLPSLNRAVEKIVAGKLDKYFGSVCLLDQAFIKNPDQTIKDLVSSKISELGENIVIRRFTRYAVGEELEVSMLVEEAAKSAA